jgi:hypothetical protein
MLTLGTCLCERSSSTNCRAEKIARLLELGPSFEQTAIFESKNVNSLEIWDLQIRADGSILLVGGTRTFLPTALSVEIMGLDQLRNYKGSDPWDEAFWEKTEQHSVAFALVVGSDGKILADRVFPDPRSRGISMLAGGATDHFMAVGSAFGSRAWVAALHLRLHARH